MAQHLVVFPAAVEARILELVSVLVQAWAASVAALSSPELWVPESVPPYLALEEAGEALLRFCRNLWIR